METIYYLATKSEAFLEELSNYFKKQGYKMEPYPKVEPIELKYLLIVEPISIKEANYVTSDLWKQWLWSKCPDSKLLLATYINCAHACALNLLDLPGDFQKWLQTVPTVKEYGFHKRINLEGEDEWLDDWKIALPLNGRSLQSRMRRFFKNHEEYFSLNHLAIELRNGLINISTSDPEENNKLIRKIKNQWEDNREFFDWFPDRNITTAIDEYINATYKMLTDSSQEQQTAPLDQFILLTKNEVLPCLFPEDYW
jgi:hypothetical protein